MSVVLIAIPILIALVVFFWLLPGKGIWSGLSIAMLGIQLIIWWCANDLDNSWPWDLNRPLLTEDTDPIWIRIIILLLLYGPLAGAVWSVRVARR